MASKLEDHLTEMQSKGKIAFGKPKKAKKGSSKGSEKVAKVMREFSKGALHSGSKQGPLVTSQKQAQAIAFSEARKSQGKG